MERKSIENLIGKSFGKLTVIGNAGIEGKGNHNQWICQCECGTVVIVPTVSLIWGNKKSCG